MAFRNTDLIQIKFMTEYSLGLLAEVDTALIEGCLVASCPFSVCLISIGWEPKDGTQTEV